MRGVDYVFAAAALKQVPSCEFFPMEATMTNVIGTNNVLLSAIEHGVKNVVVLSTDKAAYPINAMGISKALMEKVAIAKGRELGQNATTTICCTRYGNVMASRGSVIPLWVEQMEQGKPITITDPNMTRFMMTLDDAVDLVVYAFTHGENGDLFVQKELGWEPSLQFEEGIEKTVRWYLDNQDWMDNVTSGNYQKYYEEMYKEDK